MYQVEKGRFPPTLRSDNGHDHDGSWKASERCECALLPYSLSMCMRAKGKHLGQHQATVFRIRLQ